MAFEGCKCHRVSLQTTKAPMVHISTLKCTSINSAQTSCHAENNALSCKSRKKSQFCKYGWRKWWSWSCWWLKAMWQSHDVIALILEVISSLMGEPMIPSTGLLSISREHSRTFLELFIALGGLSFLILNWSTFEKLF